MNMFSLRTGLFWEHLSKGGRQFLTFGTGIKWGNLMFDVAYYAAFNRQNPLANTMKFTAIFNFPLERDKWEKKRWFRPFQKPY